MTTFDIYRIVNEAGDYVVYTVAPHMESPVVPSNHSARQLTSGTPLSLVSQAITDLERARRAKEIQS